MTVYPGAIKTWADKVDLTDFMTAGILNDDVMDEIIAIETELGTDPAGAYATVKARLDALVAVPSGGILLWPGTIANIPAGYVICDGNNSTLNLLDKFVKSVPTAVTEPGTTGGASTHTLTEAELAAHTHGYASVTFCQNNATYSGLGTTTGTNWSSTTGSNSAHQNEPQHYEIAFIMKT